MTSNATQTNTSDCEKCALPFQKSQTIFTRKKKKPVEKLSTFWRLRTHHVFRLILPSSDRLICSAWRLKAASFRSLSVAPMSSAVGSGFSSSGSPSFCARSASSRNAFRLKKTREIPGTSCAPLPQGRTRSGAIAPLQSTKPAFWPPEQTADRRARRFGRASPHW